MTRHLLGDTRETVKAELRARYEAGESTYQLAATIGYSYSGTRRLLSETGTVFRRSGGSGGSRPVQPAAVTRMPPAAPVADPAKHVPYGDLERALIRALASGQTLVEAAAAVGLSRPTARHRLLQVQRRHGLPSLQTVLVAFAADTGGLDGLEPGPWRPGVLTARQRQVLGLLRGGWSNRQIGRRLGVSEDSVKCHLTRIFRLIGARSREHAVALDWRWRYSQDTGR